MWGFKFIKESELVKIREDFKTLNRVIEDIGWTNIDLVSNLTRDLEQVISGGFKQMLKKAKIIYYNNPMIGHWVDLTTAFVFGKGISIPQSKEPEIQKVIDEFWFNKNNQLALTSYKAQLELSTNLQIEGNLFYVLFVDDMGNVNVRTYSTLEIDDIIKDIDDNYRTAYFKVTLIEKKYNFHTETYDSVGTKKTIFYPSYNLYDEKEYNIPDSKKPEHNDVTIYHVKINCSSKDKFGVPDIYRGLDWATQHKNTAEDAIHFHRALSEFAWQKSVKGTQSQINTLAGNRNAQTDRSNFPRNAGSTYLHNSAIDFDAVKQPRGNALNSKDLLSQLQLMICAGSGIFQHYYGDPSTGNLATATSMELPMVKKFENRQQLILDIYLTILDYLIYQKIELGDLSGKIVDDPKQRVRYYETDLDTTIDIDFPPIIERDLKDVAEALEKAKENRFITGRQAATQFMQAADINNIDKELDELGDVEVEDDPVIVSGQVERSKQVTKEAIKEAIDSPDKPKPDRFRGKYTYMLQRTNGYRNLLTKHFNRLKTRILSNSKVSGDNNEYLGNVLKLDIIMKEFETNMKQASRKYFPVAINIGRSYVESYLKRQKIKTTESLREADKEIDNLLEERLKWNDKYVSTSLVPDIKAKMEDTMQTKAYKSEVDFKKAINESLDTFDNRMEQYVSAFWTTEEKAVQVTGKDTPIMVAFAGPDDSSSCASCADAVAGSPYKINEAPIPGELTCLGNCRHALQIIEQGDK